MTSKIQGNLRKRTIDEACEQLVYNLEANK